MPKLIFNVVDEDGDELRVVQDDDVLFFTVMDEDRTLRTVELTSENAEDLANVLP